MLLEKRGLKKALATMSVSYNAIVFITSPYSPLPLSKQGGGDGAKRMFSKQNNTICGPLTSPRAHMLSPERHDDKILSEFGLSQQATISVGRQGTCIPLLWDCHPISPWPSPCFSNCHRHSFLQPNPPLCPPPPCPRCPSPAEVFSCVMGPMFVVRIEMLVKIALGPPTTRLNIIPLEFPLANATIAQRRAESLAARFHALDAHRKMRTAALLMRYKLGNGLLLYKVNFCHYRQTQQELSPMAYTLGHAWSCTNCVLDIAFNLIVDGLGNQANNEAIVRKIFSQDNIGSYRSEDHTDAWYGVYNLTTQTYVPWRGRLRTLSLSCMLACFRPPGS